MVFGVFDFLQKTNERIRLYYYDTSSGLVFVHFLEEIEDTKKNHFEIIWPLTERKNLIMKIFRTCVCMSAGSLFLLCDRIKWTGSKDICPPASASENWKKRINKPSNFGDKKNQLDIPEPLSELLSFLDVLFVNESFRLSGIFEDFLTNYLARQH